MYVVSFYYAAAKQVLDVFFHKVSESDIISKAEKIQQTTSVNPFAFHFLRYIRMLPVELLKTSDRLQRLG